MTHWDIILGAALVFVSLDALKWLAGTAASGLRSRKGKRQ